MPGELVDVLDSGAVILGRHCVTCDGFTPGAWLRVQTHAHTDHLRNFGTSRHGDILLTRPTRAFLEEKYPGIEMSTNVIAKDFGEPWRKHDVTIELVEANHMLGSAQVKVTLSDGTRLGYSGDFGGTPTRVIKVDQLVVDATSGDPRFSDDFTQEEAQEEMCDLVRDKLREGPVHLRAEPGPMEKAVHLLMNCHALEDRQVIGSKHIAAVFDVSRRYSNFDVPNEILLNGTNEAREAERSTTYLKLWGLQTSPVNDGLLPGTVIRLSRLGVPHDGPVRQWNEKSYSVGISHHATFDETMDYVRESGATIVVTDNFRGKGERADRLASHINDSIPGVTAFSSRNRSHPNLD